MPIAHLFWTFCAKNFELTQLLGRTRGSGYEPGGREFESLRARQSINYLPLIGNAQLTQRSESVAFAARSMPIAR